MKKRFIIGLLAILVSGVVGSLEVFAQNSNIVQPANTLEDKDKVFPGNVAISDINKWMPDKALQKIVADSLGIAVQDITVDNLKTLQKIDIVRVDRNVQSLEGLQYAENLNTLKIVAKGLTDLSPIKSLINLETMTLIDSNVSDFSIFDINTSLKFLALSPSKLYADDNRATDVETFYDDSTVKQISEKFPNLSSVTLRGYCNGASYTDFPTYTGKITDISPLAKLKNLTYLDVSQNEITDFSVLSDTLNISLSYQQSFLKKDIIYFEAATDGTRSYNFTVPTIIGVDGIVQNVENNFSRNKWVPNKIYESVQPISLKSGGAAVYYEKVSTYRNQTSVDAHDSTIYIGDNWVAEDNFDGAKDRDGIPVNFEDVQVTGVVDNTRVGKYNIIYSYGGIQKEVEVTVLQKLVHEDKDTTSADRNNHNHISQSKFTDRVIKEHKQITKATRFLPTTGEVSNQTISILGATIVFISFIGYYLIKHK